MITKFKIYENEFVTLQESLFNKSNKYIYYTQNFIDKDKVFGLLKIIDIEWIRNNPVAFEVYNDKLYLTEGHHRFEASLKSGDIRLLNALFQSALYYKVKKEPNHYKKVYVPEKVNMLIKTFESYSEIVDYQSIIKKIQSVLTPDLLKGMWKRDSDNPMAGHCYAATEALYWILGGDRSNWRTYVLSHRTWPEGLNRGETHWFLKNSETGQILDPTIEQFEGEEILYDRGVVNYMMNHPKGGSKRAREIIRRTNVSVKTFENNHSIVDPFDEEDWNDYLSILKDGDKFVVTSPMTVYKNGKETDINKGDIIYYVGQHHSRRQNYTRYIFTDNITYLDDEHEFDLELDDFINIKNI